VLEERRVEPAGLFLAEADLDLDARPAQPLDALAASVRRRIEHGDNDAGDSGGEDGLGAGAGLALMAARLERDVHRRPFGLDAEVAAVLDRVDLRVRAAELLVVALADELAGLDDDAADRRVGLARADSFLCQLQRREHELRILFVHVTMPLWKASS